MASSPFRLRDQREDPLQGSISRSKPILSIVTKNCVIMITRCVGDVMFWTAIYCLLRVVLKIFIYAPLGGGLHIIRSMYVLELSASVVASCVGWKSSQ